MEPDLLSIVSSPEFRGREDAHDILSGIVDSSYLRLKKIPKKFDSETLNVVVGRLIWMKKDYMLLCAVQNATEDNRLIELAEKIRKDYDTYYGNVFTKALEDFNQIKGNSPEIYEGTLLGMKRIALSLCQAYPDNDDYKQLAESIFRRLMLHPERSWLYTKEHAEFQGVKYNSPNDLERELQKLRQEQS